MKCVRRTRRGSGRRAFTLVELVTSASLMTVLMLGLMEGLYLRNRGLISNIAGWRTEIWPISVLVVGLVLGGTVWFTGVRPYLGEVEHFKYKKALGQGKAKEAENTSSRPWSMIRITPPTCFTPANST